MPFQLQPLDAESVHEHIFERYTLLESLSDELSQDLGIYDKKEVVHVDLEPPTPAKRKGKNSKTPQSYNFTIEQSLSSLYSSSNNNSTTGYVLWSTTPVFAQWLLYDANASTLRHGGHAEILGTSLHHIVPALFSENECTGIVELGGGISGILPITLGNHVAHYICTDQRGILNKMKYNICENLLQLNRRRCTSTSLDIEQPDDEEEPPGNTVNLEVMLLDWEKFELKDCKRYPYLQGIAQNTSTVYIIAMDVIYNDYLIDPFLKTLSQLRDFYIHKGLKVHCLLGMHLRAQDMLAEFLERAVLQYNLPVNHIVDSFLESTRFSLYYI